MVSRMGKNSTIAAVGVAVVTVILSGIVFRSSLKEQWYIWKLRSSDDDQRQLAATRLGEIGSSRTIPHLFQILRQECPKDDHEMLTFAFSSLQGQISSGPTTSRITKLIIKGTSIEYTFQGSGVGAGGGIVVVSTPGGNARVVKAPGDEITWVLTADTGTLTLVSSSHYMAMLEKIVGNDGKASVRFLVSGLRDHHWYIRYTSARLLEELGPEARDAVPGLVESRDDESPVVRKAVSRALETIRGGSDPGQ